MLSLLSLLKLLSALSLFTLPTQLWSKKAIMLIHLAT